LFILKMIIRRIGSIIRGIGIRTRADLDVPIGSKVESIRLWLR
jgi:hypothetical protein